MCMLLHYQPNVLCRSCGVPDPSWSEVRHFVKFLHEQLSSCENSPFCNVIELQGLKAFAVEFMILMSRVSRKKAFFFPLVLYYLCVL